MNPDQPQSPREEVEARVTALLLGELPREESLEVLKLIGQDKELARLHDRLKRTIDLVRQAAKDAPSHLAPPPQSLKLSPEKRQKMLQSSRTVQPKEFAHPRPRDWRWMVPMGIAAGLVLMISSLVLLRYGPQTHFTMIDQLGSVTDFGTTVATSGGENRARSESLKSSASQAPAREELRRSLNQPAPSALPKVEVAFESTPPPETATITAQPSKPQAVLLQRGGGPDGSAGAFGGGGGGAGEVPASRFRFGLNPQSESARAAKPVDEARKAGGPASPPILRRYDPYFIPTEFEKKKLAVAEAPVRKMPAAPAPSGPAPAQEPALLFARPEVQDVAGVAAASDSFMKKDSAATALNITPTFIVPDASGALGGRTEALARSESESLALTPQTIPVLGDRPALGSLLETRSGGEPSPSILGRALDQKTGEAGSDRLTEMAQAGAKVDDEPKSVALLTANSPPVNPQNKREEILAKQVEADRFAISDPLSKVSALGEATALSIERPRTDTTAARADSDKDGLTGGRLLERETAAADVDRNGQSAYRIAPSAGTSAATRPSKALDIQMQGGSPPTPARRGVAGRSASPAGKAVEDQTKNRPTPTQAPAVSPDQAAKEAKAQVLEEIDKLAAFKPAEQAIRQKTKSEGIADINDSLPALRSPVPPPPANPEVEAKANPFSTFSLNVSDVSYKLAGASLEKGAMPDPASIRSEEFINAFDYRDPEPPPGVPVALAWERARYPFAHNRDLLRFSIKTAAQGRQSGRPLNLVLVLDNSGSMERADRVRIVREALRVLASQLQAPDKISVIAFARTARLSVDGETGANAAQVLERVGQLTPEGGTNLEDALNLAYQTARRHYLAGGVNRVVLLTDGAANLGTVDPATLKQKVEAQRREGIALDCFGIGWEGYNDDLLEVLSRNGDGRYGFINSPEAAAGEFAGQLAGALRVAASDVKVQVEFNPRRVTLYRQIGYTRHQLTKEQFRDNTVDAAEMGAAEAGTALYTVELKPDGEGPIATVRVRFKVPGTNDYREHEWPVPFSGAAIPMERASPALRLAAVASGFSEWLASSPYAAEITSDRLLGYLSGIPEMSGLDGRPKRLEWMIRQAKSLTGR